MTKHEKTSREKFDEEMFKPAPVTKAELAELEGATTRELQARIAELEKINVKLEMENAKLAGAAVDAVAKSIAWKVDVETLAQAMHRYHAISSACKDSACAKAVLEAMTVNKSQ